MLSACANLKKDNPEIIGGFTKAQTLNKTYSTWIEGDVFRPFAVRARLPWPYLSTELNTIFANDKPSLKSSMQNVSQRLFVKFEIKENAQLSGLNEIMYTVLSKAPKIWQKYGKKLVVTSGLEGKHCKNSRHYLGLALDLRSRDFEKKQLNRISKELIQALGNDYQVLLESDHFHVEYDPLS